MRLCQGYYNNSTYRCMLYSNRPLAKIVNYNARNGRKVLIIRKSNDKSDSYI